MSTSRQKIAFLTTGATATFPALIEAAVSPSFLEALAAQRYTELAVQHGADGQQLYDKLVSRAESAGTGVKVTGFALDKTGLGRHMRRAQSSNNAEEGVVIAHAGSGTILDAMRTGVPTIVVPNPSLLEDHQQELADELEAREYVVKGRVEDLAGALAMAEKMRQRTREWPPVNSGTHKGLKGILDEEMGYLD
ncbi:N-acetylglucosaminyldiphosphodolichol N-acetylglucosaminyltransferase catalytic subunit alg13 [Oleoguttula sp. CCFEE 5521]